MSQTGISGDMHGILSKKRAIGRAERNLHFFVIFRGFWDFFVTFVEASVTCDTYEKIRQFGVFGAQSESHMAMTVPPVPEVRGHGLRTPGQCLQSIRTEISFWPYRGLWVMTASTVVVAVFRAFSALRGVSYTSVMEKDQYFYYMPYLASSEAMRLSRLIPRRRRRSISSTGSSEAEVPPQYADLPIFDASELRATAVRSEANGTMAYRDTERISGRSEHGPFFYVQSIRQKTRYSPKRQSYSYPSPIQHHLSTFRRCYITAETYAPASIVEQFV
ncbi:hypothetical protein R3P38DRAFT_3378071 [Favolaschia claudopus]|uniref:Uncharacterized protein n=1 Tax=Favolaschia claudopus TaxID=2862362 RepID=A0AAV9ZA21_9AGAR